MNTLETGFLIIVLSVLLVLAGYFMGGTGGMILALFFSLGMNSLPTGTLISLP
jgi:hypothetical protein